VLKEELTAANCAARLSRSWTVIMAVLRVCNWFHFLFGRECFCFAVTSQPSELSALRASDDRQVRSSGIKS